jgi:hypothetical protein
VALSLAVNASASPQADMQPEEGDGHSAAAGYEPYALSYKSGFAKMETRVGDYAVTVEKGVRKSTGSNNTLKTKLSFTTSTSVGGVATAQVQRDMSVTADYSRVCSSISEGVFDTILEETTGTGICRDDPTFRTARNVIHATIGLENKPGADWQLEAVALPVADDFGSQSIWGRGTLIGGDRQLLITYRSDSPWTLEQCLEMRQARDERKWDCYRKVVEIEDDDGLLAWFASNEDTYTFRSDLSDNLKLAVLAAIEAFRKGNTGSQGYY